MYALIRNIRLALVLTLSSEQHLFPSFVEGDYLVTSTGNLNSFIIKNPSDIQRGINMDVNQKLNQNSINKLSIKYLTIIDKDLTSIDIAIKRLLSAVCSRDNYDDALIDAVMCWENIMGSKTEVTFRTCASIAKMLAIDSNKRKEIYSELKSIYNDRSSLVHGNINYKTNPKTVQQAISYAIQLLNKVLENDDLLTMKSEDRSEYIMLHTS